MKRCALNWFERQIPRFIKRMLYDFRDKMVVFILYSFVHFFRLKEVSESKEKSGFLRYVFM